jgi:hypothetical protein
MKKSSWIPSMIFYIVITMLARKSDRVRTPSLLPSEIRPTPPVEKKVRCEDVWNAGVPTKSIESFPVFMKPSKNCAIPIDGKWAHISAPSNVGDLEAYITGVDRATGPEGFMGKSGVYTWILYRTRDDPTIKFAAGLVKSVIELGTLHHALARGTGAVTVHGAGEMKKRDANKNEILINFQSGSFMQNWVLPDTCSTGEMERFLLPKVRQMLRGMKVETPRKSTFITDELVPPTMEELREYAKKGFKICLYDSPDACSKQKGTCATPLSAVETPAETTMKGGDRPLPLTPRKSYLNRPEFDSGAPSQASMARQVFASKGLLEKPRTPKEMALTALKRPISPASVGLGRRKTRRVRRRHSTRRRGNN